MRFPNDTFPAALAATDPTEVSPKAAIVAVRRVGEGTRGVFAQMGGGIVGEEGGRQFLDREGVDRRKLCRRIHNVAIMLDTRSGEDRRKDRRRPDDLLTTMDREI